MDNQSTETREQKMINRILNPVNNNIYKILGLKEGVDESEVKKEYRKVILRIHPDKHLGMGDGWRSKQKKAAQKLILMWGDFSTSTDTEPEPGCESPHCGFDGEYQHSAEDLEHFRQVNQTFIDRIGLDKQSVSALEIAKSSFNMTECCSKLSKFALKEVGQVKLKQIAEEMIPYYKYDQFTENPPEIEKMSGKDMVDLIYKVGAQEVSDRAPHAHVPAGRPFWRRCCIPDLAGLNTRSRKSKRSRTKKKRKSKRTRHKRTRHKRTRRKKIKRK